ncbi:MAG: CTP synthase [Candidatus Pacebacteria bacterium]|jgi:CTP synthase|nr:CTP synthase [Candidatus Paceibacterota bacterium]
MAKKSDPKFIFVIGGVISGVGKGVAASSIGRILKDRGLSVTAIKIDPYVNVDAGTMNPTEHGEVFVLEDGDETDQDMGNYERFLDTTLTRINYMTTGRVYLSVIERERALEYKGKCVEVVPHIPLEIIHRIRSAQKKADADVTIIEIGGTIGEYQNMLFLEAARMMKIEQPRDVAFVMVSYLPVPSKIGEMKTKPTQHAVRTLNASGIQPDVIIARGTHSLDEKRKEKLSFFCNTSANRIISAPDVESIYDVPGNFEKEKLSTLFCDILSLPCPAKKAPSALAWNSFVRSIHRASDEVRIAVVGKYFDTGDFVLADSYLSVIEAIKYSAYAQNKKPILTWINAIDFEKNPKKVEMLSQFDGVLVPGGFGSRGVEGKMKAIRYARERKIPYFGLCYGMQLMVIEYARNVLGIKSATSREIDPKSKHLLIDIIDEQEKKLSEGNYGNSMRLGAYKAYVRPGSIAHAAYGAASISERHRHRYEVNPEYIAEIENAGLVFSGKSPDGRLCEIAELPTKVHPFFLGVQFHPEFLAHPLAPHPLFTAFIKATVSRKKSKK